MKKIIVGAIALFLLIGVFVFYKNIPLTFSPKKAPTQSSNNQVYKGRLEHIIPLSNSEIQIELDTETPRIILGKSSVVAKFQTQTGRITGFTTADKLKKGDNIEVSMKFDPKTQEYSDYIIYLRQ